MIPQKILSQSPRVLTQEQREFYFEQGYLLAEEFIEDRWLARLRDAINRQVELSRKIDKPDAVFDLEPGHSADQPRLRRVSSPCDQDILFWEFLTHSRLGDLLADLLGPDVKFYQAKLNFKWARGGSGVNW
ncbi:MAG: phytanoyl-CoA dioxygenase family protein, partial [Candidatus Binatia bacterium]